MFISFFIVPEKLIPDVAEVKEELISDGTADKIELIPDVTEVKDELTEKS